MISLLKMVILRCPNVVASACGSTSSTASSGWMWMMVSTLGGASSGTSTYGDVRVMVVNMYIYIYMYVCMYLYLSISLSLYIYIISISINIYIQCIYILYHPCSPRGQPPLLVAINRGVLQKTLQNEWVQVNISPYKRALCINQLFAAPPHFVGRYILPGCLISIFF